MPLYYRIPSSRVQTRPKPSDFSGEKILSTPFFGGEVKPSVPCRRFAACKITQKWRGSLHFRQNSRQFLAHSSTFHCWVRSCRFGRGGLQCRLKKKNMYYSLTQRSFVALTYIKENLMKSVISHSSVTPVFKFPRNQQSIQYKISCWQLERKETCYSEQEVDGTRGRSETFIHSVFCLTTGPKPPPKWCLHTVRSRASSFKWEYPLLPLSSSSSFLCLLPRLLATSISPFIFPSITCFRRQFLRKMWPIQLKVKVK